MNPLTGSFKKPPDNADLLQLQLKSEIEIRLQAEQQVLQLQAAVEQIKLEKIKGIARANERFDLLSKATNDILWDWDLHSGRLWWNENFFEQLGYRKNDDLPLPNYWEQGIHPDDRTRVLESVQQAIDAHQEYWFAEYRFLKGDLTPVDIIDRAFILYDAGGKAYRMAGAMVDITARKKAEANTEQSELRLRNMLDKMLEGIQIIGFDWRYIYVNEAMTRHGKYSREDLIGHTVMEKYPGIEKTEIFKIYQRCFNERISIHLENEFLFPNGSTGWFELNFQPVPEGIFILSVDITDRKLAEQSLLQNEAKYRTLIERSKDIIAITDENFQTIYRSPSSERVTGWSPGEREVGGTIEQTHPDDLPLLQAMKQIIFEQPGVAIPLSFRTRHRDGHYVWLEGVATNLLHEPSVKGIVTNLSDVTERKAAEQNLIRSEEIYRTIASGIPGSVICILDADYRYLLIEGDMLEKLGYSKEKLLGNKLAEVVSTENYNRVYPSLQRVFNGETFTTESGGENYDTLSRYVPLKDENNKVYAAMVVLFDVSELKNAQRYIGELNVQLEQKVIERTKQLEEANKELESFSYSVSHDLRAPLRAISGYSNILLEDFGEQLQAEGIRITKSIVSNSKRMGQLIDDLLNFSRMGRQGIVFSRVDMNYLVETAVNELMPATPNSKYNWKIHPLPDIEADPAMMKQVLLNLIENAIKYSSKKEDPQIEIGYIDDPEAGTFFIKDNGAGFDMRYAHKLFGVFQRLHNNSEFAGTGVGLALVNRIINKHRGRIWTEAAENKGATFYFSLPKTINHEKP